MFLISHNLGQNILEKFSKLSKKNFSVKCLKNDFLQFFSKIVKIFILGAIVCNSKYLRDFLEIS